MTIRRLSVVATLWVLGSSGLLAQEGPQVGFSPSELDLGLIERATPGTGEFTIESRGNEPLELHRLGVNCNCAVLKLAVGGETIRIDHRNGGRVDLVLQPGETATLSITVDVARWAPGPASKRCVVFHNAPESPLRLPFRFSVEETEVDSGGPRDPNAPQLDLEDTKQDLGSLWVGEKGRATFPLRNIGRSPLSVHAFRAECQCLSVEVDHRGVTYPWKDVAQREKDQVPWVIEPGQSLNATVIIDTKKLFDTASGESLAKAVRIFSDDPETPWSAITVGATLRSPVQLEPERIRLEPRVRGETTQATIRVVANDDTDFSIREIKTRHPEAVRATLQPVDDKHWDVVVELLDTAPIGRLTSFVEISLDGEDLPPILLPVYAQVLSIVEFRGNARTGPERLDFGKIPAGTKKTVILEIENHDPSVPYLPLDVQVQSRQADAIAIETITIEEGRRYDVHITVDASSSSRFFSGRIRVLSDHPEVPQRELEFRGWKASGSI